jgi:glycerol-3-phosphate dehydrogenase
MPTWMFGAGLAIYDVLAKKWAHERCRAGELVSRIPALQGSPLRGGYHYFDAQTDDARLVLRVLREATARGAVALNYASVEGLLRTSNGYVAGVVVRDLSPEGGGRTAEIRARTVVNATGAWADDVRAGIGGAQRLRGIRGSHLVFSRERLPLPEAIALLHPRDERAVFAVPWEGVSVFGTTDVDHEGGLTAEPGMSASESEYLFEAVRHAFPDLGLTEADVLSSFAGVRAVVNTGASDPSKESREHVLWQENGLLTVTGGKLTTFRLMALQALTALRERLHVRPPEERDRILDSVEPVTAALERVDPALRVRLLGRHGIEAPAVIDGGPRALEGIGGSDILWGELRWAARAEGVVRLEDLLLRRARVGLLLPDGGLSLIEEIRQVAQPELGWSDARWASELEEYRRTWQDAYGPAR